MRISNWDSVSGITTRVRVTRCYEQRLSERAERLHRVYMDAFTNGGDRDYVPKRQEGISPVLSPAGRPLSTPPTAWSVTCTRGCVGPKLPKTTPVVLSRPITVGQTNLVVTSAFVTICDRSQGVDKTPPCVSISQTDDSPSPFSPPS